MMTTTNDAKSNTLGDNDAFVTLIKTAMEDNEIKQTIKTIINLPKSQRTIFVQKLLEGMKKDSLPTDFIEAIAALSDDSLDERIREILKI